MNNLTHYDIFGDEYGPYGFYCTPFKYFDGPKGKKNPILIKDAWDHEFYVNGYTYYDYDEWLDEVTRAADDEDFFNEDYEKELFEFEKIVWDQYFGVPLIEEGIVDPDLEESKKTKKVPIKESNKGWRTKVSPDWEMDFSEDGMVWWVHNEPLGIAEEFDTYEDAVSFMIEFENT